MCSDGATDSASAMDGMQRRVSSAHLTAARRCCNADEIDNGSGEVAECGDSVRCHHLQLGLMPEMFALGQLLGTSNNVVEGVDP